MKSAKTEQRKQFAIQVSKKMKSLGLDPLSRESDEQWKHAVILAKATNLYSHKTYWWDAANGLRSYIRQHEKQKTN